MSHNIIACNKREAFVQGSASDAAIHLAAQRKNGLLRFARNDVDRPRRTGSLGKPGDDRRGLFDS
jgi:hypothetical protein